MVLDLREQGRSMVYYQGHAARDGGQGNLGEDYGGVTCSDFYPSFGKLPYRQQKCLIHLLKDLWK